MKGSRALACKVNWNLEVLGRRADGFHELRSWFLALDGGDRLSWEPGRRACVVTGPDAAGVPADERNLVLRADHAWRAAGGRAPELCWLLDKRLPPGSGLGAGSADAAAALQVLQELAEQPLPPTQLRDLAGTLGSDLNFFLEGETAALLGGRGERLLARARPAELAVVVAIPAATAATPEVYQALQAPAWDAPTDAAAPSTRLGEEQVFPLEPGPNDLEAAALQVVAGLASFRNALQRHAPFQMSGSGSAYFAGCRGSDALSQAGQLAARLREDGIRASVHEPWLPIREGVQ